MYHVFTEDEIKLWHDWVLELGQEKSQRSSLPALKERLGTLSGPFAKFVKDADLKAWRRAAADHRIALWLELGSKKVLGSAQARVPAAGELKAIKDFMDDRFEKWLGWGMIRALTYVASRDPRHLEAVNFSLPDPTGKHLSVSEWFKRIRDAPNSAGPARDMLEALATELKGRKTRTNERDDELLASAFKFSVPGNDGKRARETMEAWLAAGAPVPGVPKGRVKALRLDASLNEEEWHPTGQVMGFGTVH